MTAGAPVARAASRRKAHRRWSLSTQWTTAPGVSASWIATISPGKPAPEPMSSQRVAPVGSGRSCALSAMWRVQTDGKVDSDNEIGRPAPAREADRRRSRSAPLFHVKQERASAPSRRSSLRRLRLRSRTRRALAAARAGLMLTPRPWRRPRRSARRACAAITASAAGVTPSIRPAWPRLRGRTAENFCRISRDRPGSSGVVDVLRQQQRVVAPIARDVLRLPFDIDRVFGVGLEPGDERARDLARAPARRAQASPSGNCGCAASSNAERRAPS